MAGVKKSTACVTIRRVAKALVAKSALLISMPTREEMRAFSEKLREKYNIPSGPLGADSTHIRLGKAPSQTKLLAGIVPQDFRCRKQLYSKNALEELFNILIEFQHCND
jgi:hypothetical protein